MHRIRTIPVIVATLGSIAVGASVAAPALAQDPSVTLRFAVTDQMARSSDPYGVAFIDEVASRSNGSVTFEPIWDAGLDTPPGFEQGFARLPVDGDVEVALAASRGWDGAGVTSLRALEAPFLITDDDLAETIAATDIATDLLRGMEANGVIGLALWPEDLRHPGAYERCIPPIVSPDQLAGQTVAFVASAVADDLFRTLVAIRFTGDDYAAAVDSCQTGYIASE